MERRSEADKNALIAKAAGLAKRRAGGRRQATLERFIGQYYRNVPPDDIANIGAEALFRIAAGHLAFGGRRKPGRPLVRVYNPSQAEHGWTSRHTVVEVVNDDMPFLVDSTTAELNRLELAVHTVFHPILTVSRTRSGALADVLEAGAPAAARESFMHLEVTQLSGERLDGVRQAIEGVLAEVRSAVEDWRAMRQNMWSLVEELETGAKGAPPEEVAEVRDFLRWIHDNHFTFLGYREYAFAGRGRRAVARIVPGSGLGILRDAKAVAFEDLRDGKPMPPEVGAFVRQPGLLMVTKSDRLSRIHRSTHMDSIGVKRLDAAGRVIGQRLFVGLFTSVAYNRSAREIPLLRRKVDKTVQRAGFPPSSHDGKALLNILETFPRDELFQVSGDHLFGTVIGILHLQERKRVALFLRKDDFERFMSCLVFIPRDRYNTELRQRVQAILCESFQGTLAAFYTQFGDSPLARLHVIVRTVPGGIPRYDAGAVEARIVEAARSWSDRLGDALDAAFGEEKAAELLRRYGKAFDPGYRERFEAKAALGDIVEIEKVVAAGGIGLDLYRAQGLAAHEVRFKIYHPERPIPLSDVLPVFEHMGLRVVEERPFAVTVDAGGDRVVMMHEFSLESRDGGAIDVAAQRDNFHDAFAAVWRGEAESDGFNALVLRGGLAWREVAILRAGAKYLRQASATFSQAYMEETLAKNAPLARLVVDLFKALFDPDAGGGREKLAERLRAKLNAGLDAVTNADEDRILRRFVNLVDSTLRTNYFQAGADGRPKPCLACKLDSRKVDELPPPRPFREIFVYSPRVEGIHLRFGPVARGGIRWSDRREDFRTEVLGLVKAQQVKNAIIVPVGAKGGFVVKRPPAAREALLKEGIACYRAYVAALLDITDNISRARVVPPERAVRRDGDDPYLVVAADKGTATFSDVANGVSRDYGFWLGDAFASGGSQGYDHKGMGITARGAWESVKRHFREMGTDVQAQDFTAVGCGDMAGDVFGNGMLQSRHIKLIAAFNHVHVFVDPDPDPDRSFRERKRLFETPRSTWADYDPKALSKGGAVYERSAKQVPLSAEARARLGLAKDRVTPGELIRAILTADVDLMWLGGIGTYVKAVSESHADAGDRANDAVRVNGRDLRCKVVGEGANLGVTQLGRVEYALHGGRINTDSTDNSAGVNTSDHEVNIKILLDTAVRSGRLTAARRNALLKQMTDEVAALVLRHNYQQSQAISVVQAQGVLLLERQARLIRFLERSGRLDRAVEYLPDDETIAEREQAKQGLSRPEIAVLVSYAKLWLFDELMTSDLPDDPKLFDDLVQYFPRPIRARFRAEIGKHRLKREIIATRATNSLVNRVGETFVLELMEKTGKGPADIARAYTIARQAFRLRQLWEAIEKLDTKVPAKTQAAMLIDVNRLIEWASLWFLRNGRPGLSIGDHIGEFEDGIAVLDECLIDVLPPHYVADAHTRAKPYLEAGVPERLALKVAGLVNLYSGCDIVRLAARRRLPVPHVAAVYFAIGTRFRLGRLRAAAGRLAAENHWQQLAVAALVEEIYGHHLALASQLLDVAKVNGDLEKAIRAWAARNRARVEPTEQLLAELWASEVDDIAMIAVASRQLRAMAEAKAAA
jgi:glutamate dehydrogenase